MSWAAIWKSKYIIAAVAAVLLFAAISSAFLGKKVFLSGEYVFSFQYLSHVLYILQEANWDNYNHVLRCADCPVFYAYSWWYALVTFLLFIPGELIGLHPFVNYLFLALGVQALAILVLSRALNIKDSVVVIVGLLFFAFALYKTYAISSGSLYGVNHGIFLITISLTYTFIRRLPLFSVKAIAAYSLALAVLLTFFTSVSINFLPIFVYILGGTVLLNLPHLVKSPKRTLLALGLTVCFFIALSWPFIHALLTEPSVPKDKTFVDSANSLSLVEAFTATPNLPSLPLWYQITIWLVLAVSSHFFLNSKVVSLKYKILLAITFIFSVLLLSGKNFDFNLQDYFIQNIPLFQTMRAMHRVMILPLAFWLIVLLVAAYELRIRRYTSTLTLLIAALAALGITNLSLTQDRVKIVDLPPEYAELATRYKAVLPGETLYLPSKSPIFDTYSGSYNWLPNKVVSPPTFTNPLDSWLKGGNFIQAQGAPIDTQGLIGWAKEYQPDNIIIDGNFFWQFSYQATAEEVASSFESDCYRQKEKVGQLIILSRDSACN